MSTTQTVPLAGPNTLAATIARLSRALAHMEAQYASQIGPDHAARIRAIKGQLKVMREGGK